MTDGISLKEITVSQARSIAQLLLEEDEHADLSKELTSFADNVAETGGAAEFSVRVVPNDEDEDEGGEGEDAPTQDA